MWWSPIHLQRAWPVSGSSHRRWTWGEAIQLKAILGEGLSYKLSAAITHGSWDRGLNSEEVWATHHSLFDAPQPFQMVPLKKNCV